MKGIEKIVKGAMQDAEREIEREKVMKADWDQAPEWATMFGLAGIKETPVWYSLKQYQHTSSHRIFSFDEGSGYSLGEIKKLEIRPAKPEPQAWGGDSEPDAYMCPAGCGCLWLDNGDDTMSLYGPKSQSCDVCEMEPLKRMVPVKALRTKEQRDKDELNQIIDAAMRSGDGDAAAAIIAAGWRKGDS